MPLAQILLAGKGYFRNVREYGDGIPYPSAFRGRGNYGMTVAILGAGKIGRALIGLLRPFRLPILVFDPFLSEADVRALAVEKVSLEEAFACGQVVSNHLADVPETKGLLNASHRFAALDFAQCPYLVAYRGSDQGRGRAACRNDPGRV